MLRVLFRRCLAWSVHSYTALGLVAAGGMAVAIFEGTPAGFRLAFILMMIAVLIDATDGTLARFVRVKEVLPGFDGRRLDDIIDFQTYTMLPLFLIYRAQLLPEGQDAWLFVPLLASAYGFSQSDVKTPDGFFLGFPSYWNVIAFYLYTLRPEPAYCVFLLLLFSLLTFVPARYLYPTLGRRLSHVTTWLGIAWGVLLIVILTRMRGDDNAGQEPAADPLTWTLTAISLFYPAYYLGASWILSLQLWWIHLRNRARGSSER